MSVKPILFNTDMVRAILDGRKTVTRRCVKPQPSKVRDVTIKEDDKGKYIWGYVDYGDSVAIKDIPFPYHPGDILYVRERFRLVDFQYIDNDWSASIEYYADNRTGERIHNLFPDERISWRPSIHMPKEAARIWLKVTDVRVERLQDITDDDAIKEGANYKNGENVGFEEKMRRTAIERYEEIWNSTIKKKDIEKCGWDANPWVWVIEFERCEKPEEV